jgi:hypothetical protein
MFSKVSVLVTLALSVFTLASPTPGGGGSSQCNSGGQVCCNSIQPAGSAALLTLLPLIGPFLQDLNVPIGVTCSPISVIAAGGNGGW